MKTITIRVDSLYDQVAKLSQLSDYEAKAVALAGEGNEVVLTGPGPVWLYLRLAHRLHGLAGRLIYDSPASGPVVIFDHDPH